MYIKYTRQGKVTQILIVKTNIIKHILIANNTINMVRNLYSYSMIYDLLMSFSQKATFFLLWGELLKVKKTLTTLNVQELHEKEEDL